MKQLRSRSPTRLQLLTYSCRAAVQLGKDFPASGVTFSVPLRPPSILRLYGRAPAKDGAYKPVIPSPAFCGLSSTPPYGSRSSWDNGDPIRETHPGLPETRSAGRFLYRQRVQHTKAHDEYWSRLDIPRRPSCIPPRDLSLSYRLR